MRTDQNSATNKNVAVFLCLSGIICPKIINSVNYKNFRVSFSYFLFFFPKIFLFERKVVILQRIQKTKTI